jgi:hypothetical protein
MSIDPFLVWLESSALSTWVVESESMLAFPGILALHAIGMAFAAGLAAVLDLRILGVARGVPLVAFRRFLPVLWAGFWLNAVSGVLLVIAYPTKALTNPVFYLKLLLIGVAMVLLVRIWRLIDRGTTTAPAVAITLRRLAITSLVCWSGAITAGRLLAYTYTRLRA